MLEYGVSVVDAPDGQLLPIPPQQAALASYIPESIVDQLLPLDVVTTMDCGAGIAPPTVPVKVTL